MHGFGVIPSVHDLLFDVILSRLVVVAVLRDGQLTWV